MKQLVRFAICSVCYYHKFMKLSFVSQIKKWCAALVFLSFFAAAVFSVGIGMNMDDMGNMTPCAFMMGETAICPMGVSEHLNEWAGLFAPMAKSFVFLVLFAAIFFTASPFKDFLLRDRERQKRKRIYAQNSFYLDSLYFLMRAFSRGILNSRRYALAII